MQECRQTEPDGDQQFRRALCAVDRHPQPRRCSANGFGLLVAVSEGADVVLVEGGAGQHLRVARALGGRPLAVLPLPDRDAVASLFDGCGLDVHVPVPSLEDPERSLVAEGYVVVRLTNRQIVDDWPNVERHLLAIVRRGGHRRSRGTK